MVKIKTMSECQTAGIDVDILFWVGCAGSFDQRAQNITWSLAKILNKININFAVLGKEELCTGDPARRAGNEFLFQMQAYQNIQLLNQYSFKRIITTCPHCFHVLKNEYPVIGGNYTVLHHSEFLQELILNGKIQLKNDELSTKTITYHDSCYLGRVNGIYEAPRSILNELKMQVKELKRCKSTSFCCGAGGAQMFKEEENGTKRINQNRTNEITKLAPDLVATACPFCTTMIKDGLSTQPNSIEVVDIAELVEKSLH